VAGLFSIAFGHGQEAVTIDDFLVNPDGSNNLLPKPFVDAFGTLELIAGGKTKVVDLAAFAARSPAVGGQSRRYTRRGRVRLRRVRRGGLPGSWVAVDAGGNDCRRLAHRERVDAGALPRCRGDVARRGVWDPAPETVDAQAIAHLDGGRAGRSPVRRPAAASRLTRGPPISTGQFPDGSRRSGPAALPRSRPSPSTTTVTTLPVIDLYQPTGLAVSADGTVYVSSYGDGNITSAQAGEIVKITGFRASATRAEARERGP
jgi:hypothetical protein